MTAPSGALDRGTFVRVRADHGSTRAGKDGLVWEDYGAELALTFGRDRYNDDQDVQCVGPEMWGKAELDLTTAY